jgi:hypothetical protein
MTRIFKRGSTDFILNYTLKSVTSKLNTEYSLPFIRQPQNIAKTPLAVTADPAPAPLNWSVSVRFSVNFEERI